MARKPVRGDQVARYLLLGAVIFLALFGLVMIFSASSVSDYVKFGDSAYHLKRQVMWLAVGALVMLLFAVTDHRIVRRAAVPLLLGADVMLAFTLTHGIGKWGAQRWLYLGPVGPIQPSEFAKLAVVLALAVVLSDKTFSRRSWPTQAFWVGAIVLPVVVLIMAQPDMGTTMSVLIATFIMLALAGVPGRYLLGLVGASAIAVPAMIFVEPYRAQRFLAFLDPWKDPKGSGYQIIQALYAFGSGGLTGVGLGLSRQKFFYLPAAHTDFIFAIVGEELGLVGTLAVVAAFAVIVYAGVRIAAATKDGFGRLLAGGLTAVIGLQAVMNIAAVTGVMPVTGITLPLVSYGGSSVIFTLGCVGLILSVSNHGARSAGTGRGPGNAREETRIADPVERRRDGRPHLSGIDGGRAPVRRRA
jgi:cell division protein FtsW